MSRFPRVTLALLVCAALLLALWPPASARAETSGPAKYAFLFIGDGMGAAQVDLAALVKAKKGDPAAFTRSTLAFEGFPTLGFLRGENLTRTIPDSASAATAMASGRQTAAAALNYDEKGRLKFTTIAELAKRNGLRVGLVSSKPLNSEVIAAFYAKSKNRTAYYDIGLQLVRSSFVDYAAGGGLLQRTGEKGDMRDLLKIAVSNDFALPATDGDVLALNASQGRAIAISPAAGDNAALPLEMDRRARADAGLSLADYVREGIDMLGTNAGFLMVVEAGNLDAACHAGDAAAAAYEVLALEDAVRAALEFARAHSEDTLIVVAGSYETGGLALGGMQQTYQINPERLLLQEESCARFAHRVAELRTQRATFDMALQAVVENFPLRDKPSGNAAERWMTLQPTELASLQRAYELSMQPPAQRAMSAEERLLFGESDPLTATCAHLLGVRAGVCFSTTSHTAQSAPVYATGNGSFYFGGVYSNAAVFEGLMSAMALKR